MDTPWSDGIKHYWLGYEDHHYYIAARKAFDGRSLLGWQSNQTGVRRHSLASGLNCLYFDLWMADLPDKVVIRFRSVKAFGLVCIIGIGIGLTVTSWILCKAFRKRRKPDCKAGKETLPHNATDECTCAEKFKIARSIKMGGNGSRLGAGIQYSDLLWREESFELQVRHRHLTEPSAQAPGATITERDSGAAIVGVLGDCCLNCSVDGATDSVTGNYKPFDEISHQSTMELYKSPSLETCHSLSLGSVISPAMVSPTPEKPQRCDTGWYNDVSPLDSAKHSIQQQTVNSNIMKDSGYQEADIIPASGAEVSQSANVSLRSSLSDPVNLDLGSDTVAGELQSPATIDLYGEDLTDEEILYAEMIDGNALDSQDETMEKQSLFSNSGDGTYFSNRINSIEKQNHLQTNNQYTDSHIMDKYGLHLGDTQSSPCSDRETNGSETVSPLLTRRVRAESNRSSTETPSPNLSNREHSRSSSIISTDVEVESLPDAGEAVEAYDNIEAELKAIRCDIAAIETQLTAIMSVDTSALYFNVDGMKKLTRFVMNSEHVDMSSNEISKAFHILRKYRYSLTSEREPMFACREADMPSSKRGSNGSLSHLDLADQYSTENADSGMARWSDSGHEHKKQKFLFYENTHNEWCVTSDDSASVDSDSTMETCISNSMVCGSLDSISVASSSNVVDCSSPLYTKENILVFAARRWSGTTPNSVLMQKSCQSIVEDYGYDSIFVTRTDPSSPLLDCFCSAVLHERQVTVCNLAQESLLQRFENFVLEGGDSLSTWPLLACPNLHQNHYRCIANSLNTFHAKTQYFMSLWDAEQRESALTNLLASERANELNVIDALKILMLLKAVELYDLHKNGQEVPPFVSLLFTGNTTSPLLVLRYRFSKWGSPSSLQQVDMLLLAHTLGITLQVFRPSHLGAEGFVTYFPDDVFSTNAVVPVIVDDQLSCALL